MKKFSDINCPMYMEKLLLTKKKGNYHFIIIIIIIIIIIFFIFFYSMNFSKMIYINKYLFYFFSFCMFWIFCTICLYHPTIKFVLRRYLWTNLMNKYDLEIWWINMILKCSNVWINLLLTPPSKLQYGI